MLLVSGSKDWRVGVLGGVGGAAWLRKFHMVYETKNDSMLYYTI